MSVISEISELNVFEYYPNLPPEIRMIVVNEMQADDRCRFTRCSKLCKKEAKSSKKFMHKLGINFFLPNHTNVVVGYINDAKQNNKKCCGLIFEFKKGNGLSCMNYRRLGDNQKLWSIKLPSSTDLAKMAVQIFKNVVRTNYRAIKALHIGGPFWDEQNHKLNIKIENMRNVEEIVIDSNFRCPQFISKLQRPLKVFHYQGYKSMEFLKISQMIQQVEDELVVPDLKLDNEQFLRLSASYIEIHIGQLTEEDIFKFVQSWEIGERKRFESCCWRLNDSSFDIRKLFNLFRTDCFEYSSYESVFVHNKTSGEVAHLYYNKDWEGATLTFEVQ